LPLLVPNSYVAVRGARIFLEDLAQIHDILNKCSEGTGTVTITVRLKSDSQARTLDKIDELKSYPTVIDQVSLRAYGGGFFVNHSEVGFGTWGKAANPLADFSKNLERLRAPGRFAYLLQPRRLDPYRVELYTISRAEHQTALVTRERHRSMYVVGLLSACAGALAAAGAALPLLLG
jgi:hypothetical protein